MCFWYEYHLRYPNQYPLIICSVAAGIPICPLPPFHPDERRQTLLLEHLQDLFKKPMFISDAEALLVVKRLVPEFRTVDVQKILNPTSCSNTPLDDQIYPSRTTSTDETVAIMLTSGSTGNSKGVVLPHSVLLSAVKGKSLKHGTKRSDIFFNWINFDHVANVTEAHLHAIWAGASLVILYFIVKPTTTKLVLSFIVNTKFRLLLLSVIPGTSWTGAPGTASHTHLALTSCWRRFAGIQPSLPRPRIQLAAKDLL